jgi:L-aminopeptidase/D-esterase-like protein
VTHHDNTFTESSYNPDGTLESTKDELQRQTSYAYDAYKLAFSALSSDDLDPLFIGAVEAVEESVLNAMLAADTMIGKRGRRVAALDPARLKSFF